MEADMLSEAFSVCYQVTRLLAREECIKLNRFPIRETSNTKLSFLKEYTSTCEARNGKLWFHIRDSAHISPTVYCLLGVSRTVALRVHKSVMFESLSSKRADDTPDNDSKGKCYCLFRLRWVLPGFQSISSSPSFSLSAFCLPISKPLVSDVITCYSIILHDYISS
jgi:hypothetical protein